MKTYIINLPHRQDRIKEIRLNTFFTEPNESEIFTATDGSGFTFEGSKRMRGHLGCWDSHRRLMEKLNNEGNGVSLVLEDDCDIVDGLDYKAYLDELPDDWDLLYLGGINQDAPEQFSEHLDYAKNILQTHAYIIRDKFVHTLLETLTNHRWKVDIVFSEAIKRGKCFICNPVVAVQRESYSDITHS